MGSKRKRTFKSWADAETAFDEAQKQGWITFAALDAMVHDRVKWIKGLTPRRVGVCKLDAAHGGIAILVDRDGISAHYLDGWISTIEAMPPPLLKKEYTKEYKAWLDLRKLAAAARSEQRTANDRAEEASKGCQRTPIPGVVDQEVRQY